jgi:hypothetical protein
MQPACARALPAAMGMHLPAFSFIGRTLSRPPQLAAVGAMFGGARVLEHCQKEPRGRKS